MVSIPTIENGFLFATRNGAYLVERTLGVVGFSGCMKVECMEINCASGFAVFLGTHDHAIGTRSPARRRVQALGHLRQHLGRGQL